MSADEYVLVIDDQETDSPEHEDDVVVTEDVSVDQVDDTEVDTEEEELAFVSTVEEEARNQGWVPENEWNGNPDDWVPAKEFVFRGQLFDRIKSQTKALNAQNDKLSSLEKALKELGELNNKIAEKEYERAMKDLKQQRREALEAHDIDALEEVETEIEDLKERKPSTKVTTKKEETPDIEDDVPQEAVPEFKTWIADPKNQWYGKDVIMTASANAVFKDMVDNLGPDERPSLLDLYDQVSEVIKKEFPHKFNSNSRKAPANAIPSTASRSSIRNDPNRSGFSKKDLSAEQLKLGKTFVETGALDSLQEYVDQLAQLGELPSQKGE